MDIMIPETVAEAGERLNGIEKLVTAKEWERAAIVSAFVRVSSVGVPLKSPGDMTPDAFARLGINGLRAKNSVIKYVRVWALEGLERPQRGETVTLPTRTWTGLPGVKSPRPRYVTATDQVLQSPTGWPTAPPTGWPIDTLRLQEWQQQMVDDVAVRVSTGAQRLADKMDPLKREEESVRSLPTADSLESIRQYLAAIDRAITALQTGIVGMNIPMTDGFGLLDEIDNTVTRLNILRRTVDSRMT